MLHFSQRRAPIKPVDPALGGRSLPTTPVHCGLPRYSRFSRNPEFARPSLPLFVILSLGLLLNLGTRPAPAAAQGLIGQGSGDQWSPTFPTVTDWWFLAFLLGALALLISLTLVVVWLIKLRPWRIRPAAPTPPSGDVVRQAAEVLNKEIAAGILAAEEMEKRLEASKVLPAGDLAVPLQRVRNDLYDAVDVVWKYVGGVTRRPNVESQPMISIRTISISSGAQGERVFRCGNDSVPTITIPTAVKPGEEMAFTLDLENNLAEPTGEFHFVRSSLVSESGAQIPAEEKEFEPGAVGGPPVDIGPFKTFEVRVVVNVEDEQDDGTYMGLIQTTKPGQFRAVLAFRVAREG